MGQLFEGIAQGRQQKEQRELEERHYHEGMQAQVFSQVANDPNSTQAQRQHALQQLGTIAQGEGKNKGPLGQLFGKLFGGDKPKGGDGGNPLAVLFNPQDMDRQAPTGRMTPEVRDQNPNAPVTDPNAVLNTQDIQSLGTPPVMAPQPITRRLGDMTNSDMEQARHLQGMRAEYETRKPFELELIRARGDEAQQTAAINAKARADLAAQNYKNSLEKLDVQSQAKANAKLNETISALQADNPNLSFDEARAQAGNLLSREIAARVLSGEWKPKVQESVVNYNNNRPPPGEPTTRDNIGYGYRDDEERRARQSAANKAKDDFDTALSNASKANAEGDRLWKESQATFSPSKKAELAAKAQEQWTNANSLRSELESKANDAGQYSDFLEVGKGAGGWPYVKTRSIPAQPSPAQRVPTRTRSSSTQVPQRQSRGSNSNVGTVTAYQQALSRFKK